VAQRRRPRLQWSCGLAPERHAAHAFASIALLPRAEDRSRRRDRALDTPGRQRCDAEHRDGGFRRTAPRRPPGRATETTVWVLLRNRPAAPWIECDAKYRPQSAAAPGARRGRPLLKVVRVMGEWERNSRFLSRWLVRSWAPILAAALLILSGIGPAAGQAAAITPFAGVGIGGTQLPRPIVNLCGDGSTRMFAVEAVAGASSGALRFEVRAAAAHALIFAGCDPAGPFHDSGTHTDRIYHAERR
jgi:hypothetical protein